MALQYNIMMECTGVHAMLCCDVMWRPHTTAHGNKLCSNQRLHTQTWHRSIFRFPTNNSNEHACVLVASKG